MSVDGILSTSKLEDGDVERVTLDQARRGGSQNGQESTKKTLVLAMDGADQWMKLARPPRALRHPAGRGPRPRPRPRSPWRRPPGWSPLHRLHRRRRRPRRAGEGAVVA